jgi:tetratricopeptide (TPR) repeat protein
MIVLFVTGTTLAYGIWFALRQPTSQQYLDAGKKYFEKKQYPQAEIQFLNAIDQDSQNREARYLLALSYFNEDNVNAAAHQLTDLLDYFPDDPEASIRLGNILLKAGSKDSKYFRHADEIAQQLLSKDPQSVAALALWGDAAAGLGNYSSALPLFEKALSLDPRNIKVLISLGRTLTELKNYLEAEKAFLQAVQINPKDIDVLISLATYYRVISDPEKADAVYTKALSLYPSDKTVCLQAVDFYMDRGRFDSVEKVLLDAQSDTPIDPAPALLLADLYVGQNRAGDARKLLIDMKAKLPNDLNVANKLASDLLETEPDQAQIEVDRVLKEDPRNPMANILRGQLDFSAGKYDEAAAAAAQAINSPYPQAHLILGNIAAKRGRVDQAQEEFQKALERDNRYTPARLALAELFLNKGKTADSRNEVMRVLEAQPGSVEAWLIKASVDTLDKNYEEAERELNALLKAQPNNALVYRELGLYFDARGRTEDAEKSLLRALELKPDSSQILQDLAEFDIRHQQADRAVQAIEKNNTVSDSTIQAFHYELMGLVYFRSGRLAESEKAFKLALEKDPSLISSDAYLAAQYVQDGRAEVALKQLDVLIKKNPTNASAHSIKGLIYQGMGNIDEAKQCYMDALSVNPDYDTAANNLAYILSEEGTDLNSALNWAKLARSRQPENPHAADTLGWIYYKLHDFTNARTALLFAVGREPENPLFQYHLGMIYKSNTQIPEAVTALKKAVAATGDFKEKRLAQTTLAEISISR